MKWLKFTSICFLLFLISSGTNPNNTSTELDDFTYKVVVDGLSNPWGFTFLPDGSMLITEKRGELIHVKNGKKTKIEGLPQTQEYGQGGLMDIELHPNFENNQYIYFTYAASNGRGQGFNTALMRATLKNNRLDNQEILYKASPNSRRGQHFGSRIAFDRAGYVYFSVGDRGNRDENPQDITRDCGKIYRLKDDGSIPDDNPFVNNPNAKKAIYSYGHRNPQGMEINPFTGDIWTHEHGPRGGDEINIIRKGKNYGWPKITYGKNYSGTSITKNRSLPGMEQPFYYWVPSIAASGMAFVTGNKYPDWKGDLLVGSLKKTYLERLHIRNNKVVAREKIADGIGRVRDVIVGPHGFIYLAVEFEGIYRIKPN